MKISYRVVIIFGSLVMLVFSIFFFGLLLGEDVFRVLGVLTVGENGKIIKLIAFLFFFVLFLLLWMAGLHTKKEFKTIIHETELGEIRIASPAVEALALRAVKKIRGVREAEIRVLTENDGLRFQVAITSSPEVNIPQLIHEIRDELREYIQSTIGIPVNNSEVTVNRVSAEPRARVE
ncbi:MAG TPA: alkaline shock response membrane anchor protein AmaP [Firmicutes bacterium]|nr:alkaline shock response membrane anchor protein AmaP [Bacillota bacterium]